MRAALALPPIGKSISIAFALRACERAKLRERERESPSMARARQRNLSVVLHPGGGLN